MTILDYTKKGVVPLELDDETLRFVIYLKDERNLRVAEQWVEPPCGAATRGREEP